jgi:hypothetical protein
MYAHSNLMGLPQNVLESGGVWMGGISYSRTILHPQELKTPLTFMIALY